MLFEETNPITDIRRVYVDSASHIHINVDGKHVHRRFEHGIYIDIPTGRIDIGKIRQYMLVNSGEKAIITISSFY